MIHDLKINTHKQSIGRLEVYVPNRKHDVSFVPLVNRLEYVEAEFTYLKKLAHDPQLIRNRCNMNKPLSRGILKQLNQTAHRLYDKQGHQYGYDFKPDLDSILRKQTFYPQYVMHLIEDFMPFSDQFQFSRNSRKVDEDGFKIEFQPYDILIDLYQVIELLKPIGDWNFDHMHFKMHTTHHPQSF